MTEIQKEMMTLQEKEGALIVLYKPGIRLDLDMAKQLVANRLDYQKGKNQPVVIHMNGIKATSKEARLYMGKEGVQGITMGAFIVRNSIEQVILNFFLSIERPPIPTKAFTNEEDALVWIKEMHNKTS